MSRLEISRAKLNEFINQGAEFCQKIQPNQYDFRTAKGQTEIMAEIGKISAFLSNAHKHHIIRISVIKAPSYFYSDGNAIAHEENPFAYLSSIQHVVNMGRAIRNEFDRPHQVSKRITSPYGEQDSTWQPAKLTR